MEREGTHDPSPDPIRHPPASGLVTGANVSVRGRRASNPTPCNPPLLRKPDAQRPDPKGSVSNNILSSDGVQLDVMTGFPQTRKEGEVLMLLL